MEDKKKKVINTTITRNTAEFSNQTDNIYATVAMLAKRANQLSVQEKKEIQQKIEDLKPNSDTNDECYVNHEQVEMIRQYERSPKPTITATEEYVNGKLEYHNSAKIEHTSRRDKETE